jgi:heme-degrading monooxygenase HmoA
MTNNAVVLINSFEVPAGQEEAFLGGWEQGRDFLMTQDGYQSSQLHQSLEPGADFRFVDLMVWDSEAAYRRAIASPEYQSLAVPDGAHGSIYQVVRADQHWDLQLAARRRAYAAASN